jgi:transcription termination factor Rho
MLLPELKQLAGTLGIKGTGALRKGQLIEAIKAAQAGGGSTSGTRSRSSQPTLDEAAAEPTTVKAEAPVRESGSRRTRATATGAGAETAQSATAQSASAEQATAQSATSQSATGQSATGQSATGPSAASSAVAVEGQPAPQVTAQNGATLETVEQADNRSANREGQREGQGREGGRDRSRGRDNQRDTQRDGRDQNRDGQNQRDNREQNRDTQRDGQNRDNREQSRDGRDNQNRDGNRDQNRDNRQNDRQGDTRQSDRQGDRQGDNRQNDRQNDRGDEGDGRRRRRRGRDRDRTRDGRDTGGRDTSRNRGRGERFDPEPTVSDDDVLVPAAGILDVLDNYAFVRTSGYLPGPNDVYVALSMVKRYGLRKGDAITGAVKQPQEGERKEKFNPLVRIDTVNGSDPEIAKQRQDFNKLTPLYATERLRLETEPGVLTTRIVDIVSPIGKGQRGLIVSPPKAGKTMVLQALANAITTNNPEVHLMVVLVDERPEEVTDMQRTVKGEVIASTFDRPADDHTTVAELAIERAKRLVELGHDVVVLLDSITRLGRAYNIAAPASGRILSGGVDSSALYPPKRFFGAARNIEDGGSLTILATALIETGSKMDEVIFEEFKGTGNMELRLRREFADRRIFPAIDVVASGTRREELLMSKDETQVVWKLRRVLSALDGQAALELLIGKLKESKSNIEFLLQVNKTTPSAGGRNTDDGN